MKILSDRINHISESETLAMARKSRELKAQGHHVINLSIGEPDFFTPDNIKTAAKTAIDQNHSFYTPVNGYLELREAICDKLQRDNKLKYSPDQIVVSTGAKQSIANAVLCLVNEGDEVIVPTPFWVSYREIIKMAGGKAVYVKTTIENNFKITPDQLERSITPKTKLFIFSSPCNPSGSVYSFDELKDLATVFAKHPHVYIVSDEIYEYINFSGKHASLAQFDEIHDRVILINGLSKGYAMTGWRIGYMAAQKVIAQACTKLQGQITSGTSSISQRAAIEALKTDPSATKAMTKEFQERRDLVIAHIRDIPGIKIHEPMGAFYLFPNVEYYFGKTDGSTVINNSNDFCMYLINKVYVALVPGEAFGDPGCIRLSYAASRDILIEAINRIKDALSKLT